MMYHPSFAAVGLAIFGEVLNAFSVMELESEETDLASAVVVGLAVDVEVGGELGSSLGSLGGSNDAVTVGQDVSLVA